LKRKNFKQPKLKATDGKKPRKKRQAAKPAKVAYVTKFDSDNYRPIFVRHWLVRRPFAIRDEKEIELAVQETYLAGRVPYKLVEESSNVADEYEENSFGYEEEEEVLPSTSSYNIQRLGLDEDNVIVDCYVEAPADQIFE